MSYLSPHAAYFPNALKGPTPRRFSTSPKKSPGKIKSENSHQISIIDQKMDNVETTGTTNASNVPSFVRVNVFIRKNTNVDFEKANFSTCLFDYFGIEEDYGLITCYKEKDAVYLQPPPKLSASNFQSPLKNPWKQVYKFEHPAFCAVHRITDAQRELLPQAIAERGVDVGVSILLESSDGKILVTRRADHMRTFPGVWVPPGGHIEERETFEQAGIREVQEETGLKLNENVECFPIGLWESVFPAVLYEGQPKRHHLVVYLNVIVEESSAQLQEFIKLDSEEVGASMWIDEELTEIVVEGGVPGCQINRLQVPITLVNRDGTQSPGQLNPKILRKKMPAPNRVVERLTTGTRFALKLWLQQKRRLRGANV